MRTLEESLALTLTVRWRDHKDRGRSWARASRCISILGPGRGVESVTPSDLRHVADEIGSDGQTPPTINRYIAAFTAVLRTAHEEGWRASPPPPFRKGKERGRDRAPSREEVASLLRALRARGRASARLARFLYRTGMRLGEALSFPTERFDGEGVTLPDTKNGDRRVVPVPPSCRAYLRHMSEGPPLHVPRSTFSDTWRAAREEAGFGGWFTPHTLRHARATALLSAGVPIPVGAQIRGHRSGRTTQRYCHIDRAEAQRAMESVR